MKSWTGSRSNLKCHFCTIFWILSLIKDRWTVHDRKLSARRVNTHENSNDVLRVRANRINCAMPLVIMSSLHMHQLVKSMVNWNIYNDNTMTSDVSYLKNSRTSQRDAGIVQSCNNTSQNVVTDNIIMFQLTVRSTCFYDCNLHRSTLSVKFEIPYFSYFKQHVFASNLWY